MTCNAWSIQTLCNAKVPKMTLSMMQISEEKSSTVYWTLLK